MSLQDSMRIFCVPLLLVGLAGCTGLLPAPSTNPPSLAPSGGSQEIEPNDNLADSQLLFPAKVVEGSFTADDTMDVYRVELPVSTSRVLIEAEGEGLVPQVKGTVETGGGLVDRFIATADSRLHVILRVRARVQYYVKLSADGAIEAPIRYRIRVTSLPDWGSSQKLTGKAAATWRSLEEQPASRSNHN